MRGNQQIGTVEFLDSLTLACFDQSNGDFTLAARLGEIGGSPAGAIGGTPYANAPIAPWLTPATTILVAPPVVSGGADTMSPGRAPPIIPNLDHVVAEQQENLPHVQSRSCRFTCDQLCWQG